MAKPPRDQAEDVVRDHLELGMVGVVRGADVWGAGFLVDSRHVLTCAHTVSDVLGLDRHDENLPTGELELTFPFADRRRIFKASVVAWRPAGDGHADVAVLRLSDPPPPLARLVRMVPAAQTIGHKFVAWGFPLKNAGEMYAEGIVQRRRGDDRIQIIGTQATGQAVRRGFSGAPVWDMVLGGVIGMVVAADPDPASKTAYILPTDVLAEVWPSLTVTRPRPMFPTPRVIGERVSAAVDVYRDRTEFRAMLRALILSRTKRIICVTGRRGIGKSGLVAKVLADFEVPSGDSKNDVAGMVYLSTRTGTGVLDSARAFHSLARLLPEAQASRVEEAWANVGDDALPDLLAALRDRCTIMVLDNLDDLQDSETGRLADQGLITLLTAICRDPRPPLVITTSQRPIALPSEFLGHLTLLEIGDGLEATEAIELLRQLDGDNRAGLRDLPDTDLLRAAELVHRIPRGLELLVALMAEHRTATLWRLLDAPVTPEDVLKRLVSEGFQALDEVGRDVVRLLALSSSPLPGEAIPAMLTPEHPPDVVARTVERLANTYMIGFERAAGRARLHPIDADYTLSTLLGDTDKRATLDLRLADWLATQRTDPARWRTSSDLDPQRREIRHRLRAADGHGAIRIMAEIANFLVHHGEGHELADMLEECLPYADTPELRATCELSRGLAACYAGSLDEAIEAFGTGRDYAQEAGDPTMSALPDSWAATALRYSGNTTAAIEPLERAGRLPITDQESRAVVIGTMFEAGIVACYRADAAKAAEAATRMAELMRDEDPALWRGWLFDLRALAALQRRDYPDALAEVERGMVWYADSPQRDNIGYLINIRGLVLLALGRMEEAAEEFAAMREDAAALRSMRLEGFAALNLAWAQLSAGNPRAAATTAREAVSLLAANKAREARSARALVEACELEDPEAKLRGLRLAVAESKGNPDLYQPSDQSLAYLCLPLHCRPAWG